MTAEPPLRDRLLDAGRSVFADCGYAPATVDDIIERASASRATFYRYFRSKDDLFQVLSRSCFHDLVGVVAEFGTVDAGPEGRRRLEELIARFGEVFDSHRGVIRAYFERRTEPHSPWHAEAAQALGAFVDAVATSIKGAAVPSRVDPDLQAALLFLLLSRSYEYATSRYSIIDPGRLATTLAAMVHRACYGAEPGSGGPLRMAQTASTPNSER